MKDEIMDTMENMLRHGFSAEKAWNETHNMYTDAERGEQTYGRYAHNRISR